MTPHRSNPRHAGHGRSHEVYSGPHYQAPPGNEPSCRLRRPGKYTLWEPLGPQSGKGGNVAVNGAWPLDADTSDDESLARLEQHVAALRDGRCIDCRRVLCGHESLFNVAMGLMTKPRCVSCMAAGLAMSPVGLRDHLWAHFQRRDCYGEVWRRVNEREGFPRLGLPACLWPDSGGKNADAVDGRETDADAAPIRAPDGIVVAEYWDAGQIACGDLVLAIRLRMDKLASRATLKLVAQDSGAKEDLPAWCRLTGHQLLAQSHPEYWIQRKE